MSKISFIFKVRFYMEEKMEKEGIISQFWVRYVDVKRRSIMVLKPNL